MKVLHVYRTYFPDSQGGAEEVVRQICRNTKPLGIESRVFCPSSNPSPRIVHAPEAQVVRVKKQFEIASCGFCLTGLSEFRRQAMWADIIHYHFPWPFADVMHLTAGIHRPSIVTYHSDIVRQRSLGMIYQPIMDRFLRSMDKIIATSQNYVVSSDTLIETDNRVSVIPIGIDETSYPEPTDDELRKTEEEFGRDFFLFVGVWRYYKGLPLLLEALQGRPYRAVIVGSGPEETGIKNQAKELRLDNVNFPGYVDDITKICLLKLCRGFVLPSHLRSEAFGVTLLESAMMGKPMISTELGTGTSYINVDGETGLVIPPGDSNALRTAMDYLHDRETEAVEMGRKARVRFEKHFTGSLMGAHYAKTYDSMINQTEI